jgi:hypothetical protein
MRKTMAAIKYLKLTQILYPPIESFLVKGIKPEARVFVEIPHPSRVELKCSQNEILAREFWYLNIDPTPRV